MLHSDKEYTAEEIERMDAEDRLNDPDDGIDWDEVVACVREDERLGEKPITLEQLMDHLRESERRRRGAA
jgi:hypothetical protein